MCIVALASLQLYKWKIKGLKIPFEEINSEKALRDLFQNSTLRAEKRPVPEVPRRAELGERGGMPLVEIKL